MCKLKHAGDAHNYVIYDVSLGIVDSVVKFRDILAAVPRRLMGLCFFVSRVGCVFSCSGDGFSHCTIDPSSAVRSREDGKKHAHSCVSDNRRTH